jgi:hypothetical protein
VAAARQVAPGKLATQESAPASEPRRFDGGGEDCDLLSADRRVGASQNSLPRFHQRDPAVALPNFDITTMRKICQLLFCIIVVHAAKIERCVGLSILY